MPIISIFVMSCLAVPCERERRKKFKKQSHLTAVIEKVQSQILPSEEYTTLQLTYAGTSNSRLLKMASGS